MNRYALVFILGFVSFGIIFNGWGATAARSFSVLAETPTPTAYPYRVAVVTPDRLTELVQGGSGRPGERCFADPLTETLISHGGNGDCIVIDVDGNFLFVNPFNYRWPFSPCDFDEEDRQPWDRWYRLAPPSIDPPPLTYGDFTQERLAEIRNYDCGGE